jgi:hypothetical protein
MLITQVFAGNDGASENGVGTHCVDKEQIFLDRGEGNTGKFLMKSIVRFLNIEKEKVYKRSDPFNDLGRTVAAGLNAGVNTLSLGFFKKCRRKVGLSKRLAARNGKSAARIFVKGFVAKHLVHDLVGADTSAYLLDRRSRASGGALSAA